jgi:hypothetical protein
VKWGLCYVREVFVLLASCASLDVLFDPGLLHGPEVIVSDLPYCFVTAWVSRAPVVMVLPEDPSFKGVVWRDNQSSFLVPPCRPSRFFTPLDGEGLLCRDSLLYKGSEDDEGLELEVTG